jgi:hypothetical protein
MFHVKSQSLQGGSSICYLFMINVHAKSYTVKKGRFWKQNGIDNMEIVKLEPWEIKKSATWKGKFEDCAECFAAIFLTLMYII